MGDLPRTNPFSSATAPISDEARTNWRGALAFGCIKLKLGHERYKYGENLNIITIFSFLGCISTPNDHVASPLGMPHGASFSLMNTGAAGEPNAT